MYLLPVASLRPRRLRAAREHGVVEMTSLGHLVFTDTSGGCSAYRSRDGGAREWLAQSETRVLHNVSVHPKARCGVRRT